MTKLGVRCFDALWLRRTSIHDPSAETTDERLSIEDLVRAKKTQHDKARPMIRCLVEAHHQQFSGDVTIERLDFWPRELRTPGLLSQNAQDNPDSIDAVFQLK